MKYYLKELRVHHYIKNLLIFTALIFSGNLFNGRKLLHGFLGFAAFCLISSAVYIINDIFDVEKDRRHPTKCKRPIASGKIPVKNAWITFAVLVAASAAINAFVFNPFASALLALYLLLNLAYSFGLKNIPIVDVTILVSGFLIRIIYGALITGIQISDWLYLTVIAIAFYFALGKRRNELKSINSDETRKVLKFYNVGFLDKNMYMCIGLANVFYALWAMEKSAGAADNHRFLIWTFPLVLLILMKYSLNVEGDSDGDPVEVLIHDKILIILCILYAAVMGLILYL